MQSDPDGEPVARSPRVPAYDGHERSSFYVAVRDGTKLAVDLFRPTLQGAVATERLPVIWMHTPYNRRYYRGQPAASAYPGYALRLVEHGYNVAVVDYRGLYASYGQNRAYNAGEWIGSADHDAYDLTEWFARQPWATDRVGMWGCSATGGSQVQAATTRPPSLKAIMPLSPIFDAYTFGVFGGVAEPGAVSGTGHPIEALDPNASRNRYAVAVDGPDGQRQLAAAVAEHIDNADSVGIVPFRDSRSALLGGVEWWDVSGASGKIGALREAGVGVYTAVNWDELATKPAAFGLYANLPPERTKLLIGPGGHCGWDMVEREAGLSIVDEEFRFFDHWLKNINNGIMDEPAVTYFTYNADPAAQWRTSPVWPLADEVRTPFHLGPKSLLTTAMPAGEESVAIARSLPHRIENGTSFEGGITFDTPPLEHDLQVTGHPVISLWIRTDNSDVDVTARLEDVAPDGAATSYQMIGRLRASHRAQATPPYRNFDLPWHSCREADARPIVAGEPTELVFDMLPMSYIFAAGHRLRLTLHFASPSGHDGASPVWVLYEPGAQSTLTLPVIAAHGQANASSNNHARNMS